MVLLSNGDVTKAFVLVGILLTLGELQSYGENVIVDVTEGGDVWLTCSFGCNQTVQWSEKNGSIVNESLRQTTFYCSNSSLQISGIKKSSPFKCEATSQAQNSSNAGKNVTFNITVIDIPHENVSEGDNVSCPGSQGTVSWDGSKSISSLGLTKVTRESARILKCNRTMNGNYSIVTVRQTVKLDVEYRPDNITVKQTPGSNTRLHGLLQLMCEANGNPKPLVFQWFRNGQFLANTSGTYKQNVSSYSVAGGEYTCRPERAQRNKTILITITGPPSVPLSVEFIPAKRSTNSLGIAWTSPKYNGNRTITTYQVNITEKKVHIRSQNTTSLNYTATDLQPSVEYSFRVRAFNELGAGECSSPISDRTSEVTATVATSPPTKSTELTEADNSKDSKLQTGLIALGIFTLLALIVAVVFFVLYLRSSRECYRAIRRSPNTQPIVSGQIEPAMPIRERITSFSSIKVKLHIYKSDPFAIKSFQNHVKRLHRDSDYLFSLEYEAVGSKKYLSENDKKIELTRTAGEKIENKSKNRYADILPYDHNRVILTELEDDPNSDYINASYVDSYSKDRAYIAAQGPLDATVSDFWRMIWENNSRVVVMITNLFERSKPKCAKYWPDSGSADYGHICVAMMKVETFANYVVRTFAVQPVPDQNHYISVNDGHESRVIKQFHFTEWPDHDVPAHAPTILRFIHKSKGANPEGAGPIIVHCSAGVGRSGTYIVIDSMMQRIDDQKTVDIFNFLNHIRTQRNFLVQEEIQYVFVHDAINDYTHFGNSNIPIENFPSHLNTLRRLNSDSRTSDLKKEFEAVDHTKTPEKHKWVAKKACNAHKNRRKDILPVERTRVKLPPVLGIEGGDYINASYIDGFSKKGEYIATQAPMRTTAESFWRMVHCTKCYMIVMLLNDEEWEKDGYFTDLPTDEEAVTCGKLEIHLESTEDISEDVVVRKLRVFSSDASDGKSVKHYHYRHWPADGIPKDKSSLIRFVELIKEKKKTEAEKAPIIVYCDYGVGRTGIFCLLSTMYDQVEEEGSVDVYQTAKLYRVQRPQFIETEEQYAVCYDILDQLITRKFSAINTKLPVNGDAPIDSPTNTGDYEVPSTDTPQNGAPHLPANGISGTNTPDSPASYKLDISGESTPDLPDNGAPNGETRDDMPDSGAPHLSDSGTPNTSGSVTPDSTGNDSGTLNPDTPLIKDSTKAGIDNPQYRRNSISSNDIADTVC